MNKKQNEVLEGLVIERTAEISAKNEELMMQQEEIKAQAEHLQQANEELNMRKEEIEAQSEHLKQANEEISATNEALLTQKEEVVQVNGQLRAQQDELQGAYNHITDSVKYAKRIQKALLGNKDDLLNHYQDGFVIFSPKDIVSGDFYWHSQVGTKHILIAADCTGHGVPGAFMTVMGHSLINEIVEGWQITDPAKILTQLDKKVTAATGGSSQQKIHDGMDLAVLVYDESSRKIAFAGAKNPLYYVREGELHQIKGSRFPVGSAQFKVPKLFETTTLQAMPGDKFYIFTDGYPDQFGEVSGRKYLIKNFRKLLSDTSHLSMEEQRQQIVAEFDDWKGNKKQTDDILIIGLELA